MHGGKRGTGIVLVGMAPWFDGLAPAALCPAGLQMVVGPSADGGYYMLGLTRVAEQLFEARADMGGGANGAGWVCGAGQLFRARVGRTGASRK